MTNEYNEAEEFFNSMTHGQFRACEVLTSLITRSLEAVVQKCAEYGSNHDLPPEVVISFMTKAMIHCVASLNGGIICSLSELEEGRHYANEDELYTLIANTICAYLRRDLVRKETN